MEKEFEALEEIGNVDLGDNPYKTFDRNKLKNVYNKEFNILEQALTELKAIKEAKPSEAMECLNKIVESFNETSTGMYGLGEVVVANDLIYGFKEELEIIKQYILNAQAQEKENTEYKEVLSIIFEKNVDIDMIKNYQTVIEYNWNTRFDRYKRKELTEDEFNTLKRWSENEKA